MQLVRGLHGRGTTLGAGSGDLLRFIHSGGVRSLALLGFEPLRSGAPTRPFHSGHGLCPAASSLSVSLTLPLRCPLWLREFSLSLSLLAATCPISQRSRR